MPPMLFMKFPLTINLAQLHSQKYTFSHNGAEAKIAKSILMKQLAKVKAKMYIFFYEKIINRICGKACVKIDKNKFKLFLFCALWQIAQNFVSVR
jgi:hypothetical protein